MKDPVSISGCWRGFRFGWCLAVLVDKRLGNQKED
jgi:hypothetical protein